MPPRVLGGLPPKKDLVIGDQGLRCSSSALSGAEV
jgi:hypothetical protein